MYIDTLLLILCISFAFVGLWQGFVHQLVSLLGIVAIVMFSFPLAQSLKSTNFLWFSESPLLILWAIACFMIFSASYLTRLAVGRWLTWSPLGAMDRWMGFTLGGIKGVLLTLILAMGVHVIFQDRDTLTPELHAELEESKFLVASSDLLSIGIFGWSDALSLITEQVRSVREQPRLLSPDHPWTDEFD